MLPFLKNKQEASMSESEDGDKDYGTLDAVAQDMMEAFDKKDSARLKSALESLCEYVRSEDVEQDQSLEVGE